MDQSEAFDKVWCVGFIYKLKKLGIFGNPLKLSQAYLDNRFQRVILVGQSSEREPMRASVPQV